MCEAHVTEKINVPASEKAATNKAKNKATANLPAHDCPTGKRAKQVTIVEPVKVDYSLNFNSPPCENSLEFPGSLTSEDVCELARGNSWENSAPR